MKKIIIGFCFGCLVAYVITLQFVSKPPLQELADVQSATCSVSGGEVFVFINDRIYSPLIGALFLLIEGEGNDQLVRSYPIPRDFNLNFGYSVSVSLDRESVWLDVDSTDQVFLLRIPERKVSISEGETIKGMNGFKIFQSIPFQSPIVSDQFSK